MTLASWLRGLDPGSASTLKGPPSAAHRTRAARFRPGVELLEDRTVPSATLITSTTTIDNNNDGTVDGQYRTTNTLDNHGNLLSSVRAYDYNGDGVTDAIYSNTQTFDNRGNVLSAV